MFNSLALIVGAAKPFFTAKETEAVKNGAAVDGETPNSRFHREKGCLKK